MTSGVAEIFSQGDEVLTGQVADTNAAWLARRLSHLGFDLVRHSAVGDHLMPMVDALRAIAVRADLCICTGGLGPTVDDLTAEAVAAAFGHPLELDQAALEQIEAFFSKRGSPMAAVNRKQALLPKGAERLDNHWGTAPGFLLKEHACTFVFLPGVPAEMQAMFDNGVEARLKALFHLNPGRLMVLRTFGLGESALQQRLSDLNLPVGVRLGFRAGVQHNEVKLAFPADCSTELCSRIVERAAALIGEPVFSISDASHGAASLADVVGARLTGQNADLATAETFSGGQLATLCHGNTWIGRSVVAPTTGRLAEALGLDESALPDTLEARAGVLADALRRASKTAYALSLIGDDEGAVSGAEWPPPSAVAMALAGPTGHHGRLATFAGQRQRRQLQAASAALDLLRRYLSPGAPKV